MVKWVREGQLAAHTTPGGHRRIAVSELERFAAAEGLQAPAEDVPSAQAPCILIMDPGVEFSRMLQEMLSRRVALEVLVANDAFTAGFLCGTRRPHLIVVDPSMPDLDPWAALASLRVNTSPPPKVVALSAVVSTELRALHQRGIVDAVLGKPYDLPRLWEAVNALLSDGGKA